MRALFATQPGVGHLYPLLPVADGLRRRGHEVAFVAAPRFGPEITAAGHTTFAVGLDWLTVEMATAFPEMLRRPPGPERYAWARATIFAHDAPLASVPDILTVAERWSPDLVVREAADYGGCLAAELLGLPHAVVRTDSGSSSYADRHLVGPALDAVRVELGLPPDPDVAMPFQYLQLSFAPPGLDEPAAVAAPTCHHFRPVDDHDTAEDGQPPWLADRPDQPLVWATLGTIYNDPKLFAVIIEALADEPMNVVATIGRNQDPGQFGPLPANIRVERWIPQGVLLAQCDAVITHGGYGTVAGALARGLPLVFIPISADQPLNAARCVELGVAQAVGPDERTPDAIRSATRAVLDEPDHRCAARAVAREISRRPGVDQALDLLEVLARDRTPLLAVRPRAEQDGPPVRPIAGRR